MSKANRYVWGLKRGEAPFVEIGNALNILTELREKLGGK
jgi:hypothetical protein